MTSRNSVGSSFRNAVLEQNEKLTDTKEVVPDVRC